MAVGSVGDTGHGLVLSLAADREVLEGLLDDLSESDGLLLRKIDQQVVDGGIIQDLNICHIEDSFCVRGEIDVVGKKGTILSEL